MARLRGELKQGRRWAAPCLGTLPAAQPAGEIVHERGWRMLHCGKSDIAWRLATRALDFQPRETAVDGLWPDITFVLDVDPEIGLERARRRNVELGLSVSEGRFEAEAMEFHRTIRQGYLDWAAQHPERFRIINGGLPPEAVFHDVWSILSEAFSL